MRFLRISVLVLLFSVNGWTRSVVTRSFSFSGEGGDNKATLTINADGSAKFVREATQPRAQAEQVARMWAEYRNRAESDDSDETPAPAKPADKSEPMAMTDEELEKAIRATFERAEESYGMTQGKLDKLEISKEQVKTITSQSFANLDELMASNYSVWGQAGIPVQSVKIEKDAENHLKLTVSPQKMPKRYAAEIAKFWKTSKAKVEFHVVLPGKIISSGFPESNGNTAGFAIDGAKPETLAAAEKLGTEPLVIVAELGGLKIDQPLDSTSASRAMMRLPEQNVANVPITEGGEGFAAEASSVTTVTTYLFPDAQKQSNERFSAGGEEAGTTVHAKIFGPKDRTLQSVTEIHVVKAVDDKGREIKKGQEAAGAWPIDGMDFSGFGKKASNSKQVQIRLGLPEPDAKSIEEVTLQAVVQSVGKWKEMAVPLQDGKTNEIDLTEVLPGAKLAIRKVTLKGMQVLVDGVVKGPAEIQQLDFQLKPDSNPDAFQMQPDYNPFNRSRDKGSRKVTLRGYMMRPGAGAPSVNLQVRLPIDTKRERVQFKLTGLDLF